jgi:DNA-binding Lrp family transcriptional regulator
MITAIVLIKAEPQRIAECATKLAGIEGISQVYSVSGEWDLVAMVEVAEHEAIARIVTEEVTVVPGIKSTHTLTAFRAYSKKDLEQAWDIGLRAPSAPVIRQCCGRHRSSRGALCGR